MHAEDGPTRRRARTHGHVASAERDARAPAEELHAEPLEALHDSRLQAQIARDEPRALAPLLVVPPLVVHGRGAVRTARVAAAIVVRVHRPRQRTVYLLPLLAGEHRRGELRRRELTRRSEVILERVRAAAALEEWRPAGVAHASVLARRECAPLDVRPAGVKFAKLDLIKREHQRGHEPIRLVVIGYSQRPPIAAHATRRRIRQLVTRSTLELPGTLVRPNRLIIRTVRVAVRPPLAHGSRCVSARRPAPLWSVVPGATWP